MRAEGIAVAKPRVTRRTHIKKPWYERPALLFIALIIALGVGGVVVSRFLGASRQAAMGPRGPEATPESPAGATESPPATAPEAEDLTGLLGAGDPLPSPRPGTVLPPIHTVTITEASRARQALRVARTGVAKATPAFVEGTRLVDAAAGGVPAAWDALPLRNDQRAFCDFEVCRAPDGSGYLVGFVSVAVARALAALGPTLAYSPAGQEPPHWQVWKKHGKGDRIVLRAGSEIILFPDLGAEATCIVELPLERFRPLRIRRIETGWTQPAEVLEVALH
jgi:hypothetical protein